jgi:hypothetical protein
MSQSEVSYILSWEAVTFLGVAAQAAAIVWLWRDWKMSQFQHKEWRNEHRQSEGDTLKKLAALWVKFGGPSTAAAIDWDNVGSAELDLMSKAFPAHGDDESLKKRKLEVLTPLYGIGPSDADLVKMRRQLEHLALLRRGIADYRTFIRKRTFQTALNLMLVGFALQLLGSWPSRWFVPVEEPSAMKRPR